MGIWSENSVGQRVSQMRLHFASPDCDEDGSPQGTISIRGGEVTLIGGCNASANHVWLAGRICRRYVADRIRSSAARLSLLRPFFRQTYSQDHGSVSEGSLPLRLRGMLEAPVPVLPGQGTGAVRR